MDSSSSRAESVKPVILKAGVALILSATGLILARFMVRKEDDQVPSSASSPENSLPLAEFDDHDDDEEEETGLMEDAKTLYKEEYEQDILRLKARCEELQKKEYEMEMRFEHYCNLKAKESMLVELKGMLKLEKARLDFFGREVLTMEEENKRIQDLASVYLKLGEKIQCLKSENGLLQSKAKKLTRRTKELSSVIKEKNTRISGLERMFLRNLEELETKNNCANKMGDEIKELKTIIDRLQEKNELLSKSSNPKPEMVCDVTTVTVEDYKRLLEEYERLKREREDEVKDLINLKWSNACLKHTLMKYHERDQANRSHLDDTAFGENENFHHHMSLEEQMALDAAEEHQEHEEHHHETSRRKRLVKKLKKWLEGHEKGKSKSEERCLGRYSLTDEPDEEQPIVPARRSCSSA